MSKEVEAGYETGVAQLQTLNQLDELFPGSGPFSNVDGLPSTGFPKDPKSYCLAFSTSKPLRVSSDNVDQDTAGYQKQLIVAFPAEGASIKDIEPSSGKRIHEKDKQGDMVEKILLFNPHTARYYLIVTKLPSTQEETRDIKGNSAGNPMSTTGSLRTD